MYKSFCAVGACFWVSPAGCQCNGFKMRQRPPYWSQCLQAAVLSVVRRVRIKVGKGEQKTEDGSCELSNICLSWQDSFFFFSFFLESLLWAQEKADFFLILMILQDFCMQFWGVLGLFLPVTLHWAENGTPSATTHPWASATGGSLPLWKPSPEVECGPFHPPGLAESWRKEETGVNA